MDTTEKDERSYTESGTMRIQPLSETQKYELLLSVLQGKAMTFNDTVGHLVIDYMPEWDVFSAEVQSNISSQKKMGGSWSCIDCIDLQKHIEQINALTHRSYDYNDPNEEDFTCNCSYCQIVLEQDCDCGRCELNAGSTRTFIYKDYVSGKEIEVQDYQQLYMDGMITEKEYIFYTEKQLLESKDYLQSTIKEN